MRNPKEIFSDVFAIVKDYALLLHKPRYNGEELNGEISTNTNIMDTTPTDGSNKLVNSGGIKAALDLKQDNLTPENYIYIDENNHIGTTFHFDEEPTDESDNLVTSGAVYNFVKANSADTYICEVHTDDLQFSNLTYDEDDVRGIRDAVNAGKNVILRIINGVPGYERYFDAHTDQILNLSALGGMAVVFLFTDGNTDRYFTATATDSVAVVEHNDDVELALAEDIPASLVDTVIEESINTAGTPDVWSYRKWSSGLKEAWISTTVENITMKTDGGIAVQSGNPVMITHPTGLFTSTRVHTSVMCGSVGGSGSGSEPTWAIGFVSGISSTTFRLASAKKANEDEFTGSCEVSVYVIGI